jgi:hypothetical protein
VDDTPRDKKPYYGLCPPGVVRDTCTGKKHTGTDPLSNYMQVRASAAVGGMV